MHDAARALTPSISSTGSSRAVARAGMGVIPGSRVIDTIKRVAGASGARDGRPCATSCTCRRRRGSRERRCDAAYADATVEYTDDAALFGGGRRAVDVVEGEARAFKITTAVGPRAAPRTVLVARRRDGHGCPHRRRQVDVHALRRLDAPLWLGGLVLARRGRARGPQRRRRRRSTRSATRCSRPPGSATSAARFGTNDPRFDGAHSEVFLRETLRLVTRRRIRGRQRRRAGHRQPPEASLRVAARSRRCSPSSSAHR